MENALVGKIQTVSAGSDLDVTMQHQALDALINREEIRNLPIKYCFLVHQKDVAGIVDLFTSDGEITLSAELGGAVKGSDELRVFYKKSIESADPWPFVHNHHIIMLDEDSAKGYIYAEIRYGSHGYRTVVIGVYEDEYVKVAGSWKFKSRVYKSHSVAN